MATKNGIHERIALRRKLERCQHQYDTVLKQGQNTAGVFSGGQLSGGLAALPSQIAKAKANLEDAQVALDQYDAEHPVSN